MTWEWSDIRYFLAVARTGSTLGAARSLGVNQTTCARRIAALETALDAKLFERKPKGYDVTTVGSVLIAVAERIEAEAGDFARLAADQTRAERKAIRFTTSDMLAELIAKPAITAFARSHPDVRVVLDITSRNVDLGRGEADVALRAEPELDDPSLVARKVMDTPWGIYCHEDYAKGTHLPQTFQEMFEHPLAMLAGRPTDVILLARPDADLRQSTNNMTALVDALLAGDCIGAIPLVVGDRTPRLVRCFVLDYRMIGIWILYHERLRKAPHIRAFVDHLVETASICGRAMTRGA